MSNQHKFVAVASGGIFLFVIGLWLSMPGSGAGGGPVPVVVQRPESVPSPTEPGIVAPAKPSLPQSRLTPTPYEGPRPLEPPPVRPLSPPPSAPPQGPTQGSAQAWVVQDGAKIYTEPKLSAPVVSTLRYGDRVAPMEFQGNWQKILLADKGVAWIQSEFISVTPPEDLAGDNPQAAIKTVTSFYDDLNARDYSRAYNRLSFEWKRELDFTAFEKGYKEAQQTDCKIMKAEVEGTRLRVHLELRVAESRRRVLIRGTYTLALENAEWKLDSGDLREVAVQKDELLDDEDE